MGDAGGVEEAVAALHRAASDKRVTLTEHNTAMKCAGDAVRKINEYMATLRRTGKMREFNRAFKARRMAAETQGKGFMTYAVAEARLRRALIPLLVGGQNVGPAQSLFAEIFGTA